jgi:hypothetical protein
MIRLLSRLPPKRQKREDTRPRDPLFMFATPPDADLHPRGGL